MQYNVLNNELLYIGVPRTVQRFCISCNLKNDNDTGMIQGYQIYYYSEFKIFSLLLILV